jgi:hypothetical protein
MSVSNNIQIAKVTIPLVIRDIDLQLETDRLLPRKIYMAYQSLNDLYTQDPNNANVTLLSNYLYTLCGGYYFEAQNIITVGGGGTLVNPSTGFASSLVAFNIQFTVGVSGMVQGDTVYTVTYPYIMNGSITVEMPQSNLPIDEPNQLSYEIVYTNTYATITFLNGTPNIGVQNGMLFLIKGFRFISAQASGSTSSSQPKLTWLNVPTDCTTFNTPLSGYTVQIVFRGGLAGGEIILGGTPTGTQILFDSNTGNLTVAASNGFVAGEQLAVQYI